MKKFLGLLSIMALTILAFTSTIDAQSNKRIIDMDKLSPELQVQILQSEKNNPTSSTQIIEQVSKFDWEAMGKGIGKTVNEALSAVVDVADKFGATKVGQFTMVMVAWKVIGKDVVKIIIGLLFFITFTSALIFTFKRLTKPRRILIENPGLFRYPKKYQIIESKYDAEDTTIIAVIFIVAFLIGIWVTYSVMF